MQKFKTRDLKLASFLYASHLTLDGYEKVSSEIYFTFTPYVSAQTLHKNYIDNTALVSPKDLLYQYNNLKSIIFSLIKLKGDGND